MPLDNALRLAVQANGSGANAGPGGPGDSFMPKLGRAMAMQAYKTSSS